MPWYRRLHWQIIIGLILGLFYGIVAAANGWGRFTAHWIAPFGTIFLNALKLIAIPLILGSLITGVTSLSDLRKLSRIGGKTIAIYVATTAVAVTIGLLAVNFIRPGRTVPESMRVELQAAYEGDITAREAAAEQTRERGPLQLLVDIVPENAFASTSSNVNMLQVVFLAFLVGVGLMQLPADKARPLVELFQSLNAVVIRLVDVIMLIAPLGVFALIASTITTVAGDDLGRLLGLLSALGLYMITVVLGLAIHMGVTYTVLLRTLTPVPVRRFYQAIAPAQLVAFSTSSSGATLPVTMERCEENLGVSKEISSFVLPLGATINMDGTALYQAVAAVFIAQTLGLGLGLTQQLTIVLTAVLASIGTAAVPGVGIIMLVIILEAIGVPAAGIGLILGVDRILDMLRTTTNITGDCTVAAVMAAAENQLHPVAPAQDKDVIRTRAASA